MISYLVSKILSNMVNPRKLRARREQSLPCILANIISLIYFSSEILNDIQIKLSGSIVTRNYFFQRIKCIVITRKNIIFSLSPAFLYCTKFWRSNWKIYQSDGIFILSKKLSGDFGTVRSCSINKYNTFTKFFMYLF